MPGRSSGDDLRERISRLEDQHDDLTRSVTTCETLLSTHEQKFNKIDEQFDKIDEGLKEIQTLIEKRTSQSLTLKHLGIACTIFVVLTLPLLGFSGKAISAWYLPQRIERVSIESESVNSHLAKTISASVAEGLKPTNEALKDINARNENFQKELDTLKTAVGTLTNRTDFVRPLKHATAAPKASSQNLIRVQNLLNAVREFKVPLERQDYKDLSVRLFHQYLNTTDPEERNALLDTFIQAANAKSVSEPTKHKVSDRVFDVAKKANNYFEGTVDLSSREEWKHAVFNNCNIQISKPDVPIVLTEVRFLDCNFDSLPQSAAINNFLSEYLETTRATLSYPGYKVLASAKVDRLPKR